MVAISVVIPVFNGAAYLEETIAHLRQQTFSDFEVWFTDDHSTDNSASILQRAAQSDKNFHYIKTPKNLGSAGRAVNFALPHLNGDYLVYSSQDDIFSSDWLSCLYDRAQETDADATLPIVQFYYKEKASSRRITGINGNLSQVISGSDAFTLSLDWTIPGNALWRTSIARRLGFSEDGAFADEYTVRLFFLHCEKVAFCRGIFYYRQDNPNAITKKVSPSLLDIPFTQFKIWELTHTYNLPTKVKCEQAHGAFRALRRAQILINTHNSLGTYTNDIHRLFDRMQTPPFQQDLIDIHYRLIIRLRWIKYLVSRSIETSWRCFELNALLSVYFRKLKLRMKVRLKHKA